MLHPYFWKQQGIFLNLWLPHKNIVQNSDLELSNSTTFDSIRIFTFPGVQPWPTQACFLCAMLCVLCAHSCFLCAPLCFSAPPSVSFAPLDVSSVPLDVCSALLHVSPVPPYVFLCASSCLLLSFRLTSSLSISLRPTHHSPQFGL